MPDPLWGGLAVGDPDGPLALPAAGRQGRDGKWRPALASDWRLTPPWADPDARDRRFLLVNWPGTHSLKDWGTNTRGVSDVWFRDPTLSDGVTLPDGGVGEIAELRLASGSLDPGVLRLLLPDLTEAECAADVRTAQLERAVCQMYSVLNVAVCLLESEPWDEAWIRMPFLAEVAALFGACSDLHGLSVGSELRRRYGSVLGNAHRLLDAAVSQCVEAAGPDVTVGLFGGWRWRPAAGGAVGPLGGLARRSPEGCVVLSGPGIARGMEVPISAGACMGMLRRAGGTAGGSRPAGGGTARDATASGESATESMCAGALDALASEGALGPGDAEGVVAAELLDRSTAWFDAQRRAESGDLEEALPSLVEAWRLCPEFTGPTVALGNALIPQARPDVLVRLADLLLDDGPGSPLRAVSAARLLVAAGDPASAERLLVTCGLSAADPAGWKVRAEVHLRRRETAEAFQIFGEWVRSRPGEVDGWIGLARCYVQEHRLADALAALVHARTRCPDHGGLRELEAGLRDALAGSGEVPGMGCEPSAVVGPEVLSRAETAGYVRPDLRLRHRFHFLPGGWQVPDGMEALAWLAGDPVRIAGFASWELTPDACRLRWMVRSRWELAGMGAARFLRAAVEAIRASAPALPIVVTMGGGPSLDDVLLQAGFECVGTDQMWVFDDIPERLSAFNARQDAMVRASSLAVGWSVRDAVAEDIEWLFGLFCRPRLMSEARCRAAVANPVGRMVLVAEKGGVRQGAALLRQHGLELVLEVENADLRSLRDRAGFKFVLYREIGRRLIDSGAMRLRLTTNKDTNRRIPNFVAGMDARMEGETRVFRMLG